MPRSGFKPLVYSESRQCLKFVLKVNNETVYIENLEQLIGTRIRDDSKITYIIESIEFIINQYKIIYSRYKIY